MFFFFSFVFLPFLVFVEFLVFPLRGIPCFFEGFSLLFQGFYGFGGGGGPLFSPTKQGKEGRLVFFHFFVRFSLFFCCFSSLLPHSPSFS